jgi:hypothetical protein
LATTLAKPKVLVNQTKTQLEEKFFSNFVAFMLANHHCKGSNKSIVNSTPYFSILFMISLDFAKKEES